MHMDNIIRLRTCTYILSMKCRCGLCVIAGFISKVRAMEGTTFYEPTPRAWHCSVSMRYHSYVIGGCPPPLQSIPPRSPSLSNVTAEIQSKVEIFDVRTKQWKA